MSPAPDAGPADPQNAEPSLRSDDLPRTPTGPGFRDAVTYAWGDVDAGLFGSAHLELTPAPAGGGSSAGGHALLFAGSHPVAARAATDARMRAERWDDVAVAGIRTAEHAAWQAWDVQWASDDGASGFALRFQALTAPLGLQAGADADGMEREEQLCRVTGIVTVDSQPHAVDCLGQRDRTWGVPPTSRVALQRSVTAWLGEDLAVSVTGVRSLRAKSHADEALSARLVAPLGADGAVLATRVPEVRLSATTDAAGGLRFAGIEVYLDEEDPGHRAAGQVLCGTRLDLGHARLDCAWVLWRMEGRTGVGRYDVLRPVA